MLSYDVVVEWKIKVKRKEERGKNRSRRRLKTSFGVREKSRPVSVHAVGSPDVIEPYTPRGYIIWWGLQSSPLYFSLPSIIRYKYLACRLDSPSSSLSADSRSARRIVLVSPLAVSARANDKLCTRICIFDTWLQRPGRNAPGLSYVTGRAARSFARVVFLLSRILLSHFFPCFFPQLQYLLFRIYGINSAFYRFVRNFYCTSL